MKQHLPEISARSVPVARMIRKQMTDAERKFWSVVRGNQLGIKFRRQCPIGPYVVDFYPSKIKLVIELDGSQHHSRHCRIADHKREEYLAGLGIKVIRYCDSDVLQDIDGVIQDLTRHFSLQLDKTKDAIHRIEI